MENNNRQKKKSRKEAVVDTLGLVASSLTGAVTDYLSGLSATGILAARAYSAASIIPTGGPYGRWRNFLYKKTRTTDKSSKLREGLVELLAFDTFQVPLYATTLAAGNLASHLLKGEFMIDLDKVQRGTELLAAMSPFVAAGTGIYMDFVRKLFRLDPAPKEARKSLEGELTEAEIK